MPGKCNYPFEFLHPNNFYPQPSKTPLSFKKYLINLFPDYPAKSLTVISNLNSQSRVVQRPYKDLALN